MEAPCNGECKGKVRKYQKFTITYINTNKSANMQRSMESTGAECGAVGGLHSDDTRYEGRVKAVAHAV